MSAVSVRDLEVGFGGIKVLEKLNLDIKSGEFVVLLGPSGCGKSTLLNSIAGLIDASAGQIWIGDRNVTWADPSDRNIGMVFQSYALYPRMSVRNNLAFGLRMNRTPRAEIEKRVSHAAHMLQIEKLLDRRPAELSGGQRQRVAIGRALVRNVGVFLFDEPLSNLDAKLRTELRVEIKRLHQQLGVTMIFVTHDQVEALTLADRIVVLDGGRVQQIDTPKEVYQRPSNLFVAGFVGSPAMNCFSGEIISQANSRAIRLTDGQIISLAGYPFKRDVAEGSPVVLGLRPELLSLEPKGEARFRAKLSIVEPMGPDTLAWGEAAGSRFSVRLDADSSVPLKDDVDIHFDPAAVSIFDEGGQRL